MHKQKKLSKAAKREANALARNTQSKPSSSSPALTPDDYQWQVYLKDEKNRKLIEAATTNKFNAVSESPIADKVAATYKNADQHN